MFLLQHLCVGHQKRAGLVPDTNPDGNYCSQLQTHDCTLTAVALSRCDTMMASADASGKLVIRFSSCL